MTAENMDPKRMRIHNSRLVLGIVRRMGPVSRADITRHTPYSAPTISALISGLIKAGLVSEEGEGASSGGRKPQLISFNSHCGYVVGCNIDSHAVQIVLADMSGNRLSKRSVPLNSTRPKPLLRLLSNAVGRMLREAGCKAALLAVAVGVPGMTDMERGEVIEAANLDGWVRVPAREILQSHLDAPVVVDNDVNLAAIGEQWHGVGRGVKSFVFISVGTGIGAGIIIDGALHRGHRWHAGEISHLNVDYREWATDYGAAGYLETHLIESARRRRRGRKFEFDDETVQRLGAAVANIATLIDPETIIFGGSLIERDPDALQRIYRVASRIAPNCPELLHTELGEDAALTGSVQVALQRADESLHDLMMSRSAEAVG